MLLRLTDIYTERDYKYEMIERFEKKEAERKEKDFARRLANETKRQQQFAQTLKDTGDDGP